MTTRGRESREDMFARKAEFCDEVRNVIAESVVPLNPGVDPRSKVFNLDQIGIFASTTANTTVEQVGVRVVPALTAGSDSQCGVAERTNIIRCGYPPKPQQPPSRVGACFGLRRGWSPRGSALPGQWVSRLGRHRLTKSATPEPSRASWLHPTNNPVPSSKGWTAAR
ncbi:unnamed protein product [Phytophthora fragariaefolia]|uniref:Unnamed protein product n=1 Tax=Phytophthora fragariaefolia TaxID=1490495 RepID=A0A9W6YH14_9STRA|nr:unnamed protein product [Phytophthora fragariaefolia]